MDDTGRYCKTIWENTHERIEKSFNKIIVHGEENLKQLPEDSAVLYASLHKSHMDYFIIPVVLIRMGFSCPAIAAGENLFKGPVGDALKKNVCDIAKAGAVPIKRGNATKELIEACGFLEAVLMKGNSALIFPEAKDREGKIKTGRSYDGRARYFAPALFSSAVNACRNSKEVYVVPMAVSYEFVPESFVFPELIKCSEMMKSEDRSAREFGKNLYLQLERRTFEEYLFNSGGGNVYIDFSEPISVRDFPAGKEGRTELALASQKAAFSAHRATPIAILSRGLLEGKTDVCRLIARCSELEEKIKANHGRTGETGYASALEYLKERKVVELAAETVVLRKEIVEYNANTIEHLL
jgi:glycerol-3-phosphate O-acyltransferase